MFTIRLTRTVIALGALVCAAVSLALAPPAKAGTYTVFTCRLPSGASAPTDGWRVENDVPGLRHSDSCASGGYLRSSMEENGFPEGTRGGWAWTGPAAAALRSVTLWRSFALGAFNGQASPYRDVVNNSQALEADTSAGSPIGNGNPSGGVPALGFHPTNQVQHSNLGDNVLRVRVGCAGFSFGVCPLGGGLAADQRIFAAWFRLEDSIDPIAQSVAGPLARGDVHAGEESVTFSAADIGAGVYRGLIEIDGNPVKAEVLDSNGGRCVDASPGDSDSFQFVHLTPCKASANGTIRLDTRTISDGPHDLRIRVEDASGNRGTVFGSAPITINNAPPLAPPGTEPIPNGARPSRAAKLTVRHTGSRNPRRTRRLSYRARATMRGLLVDEHTHPIAGAAITVLIRHRSAGAPYNQIATVTTAADGTFSYQVASGPSRSVLFSYTAFSTDPTPATQANLLTSVRASIAAMRASPRSVRVGRRVRLTGRLRYLGRPGVQVGVQVRDGRRWRTIGQTRTGRQGRFTWTRRFRRTPGGFVFRARVTSPVYPFAAGHSTPVRVRVRG